MEKWIGVRCIRTTFEYQLLEEIRRKLRLARRNLKAPAFEKIPDTDRFIRHCHLVVRQFGLYGEILSRPLFLGVLNGEQMLEFYMTNCLDDATMHRDKDNNWVYAQLDFADPKSLTTNMLRETARQALVKSTANGNPSFMHHKPLIKRPVIYPTAGPYYWSRDIDLERDICKNAES
jgi:hypothetical protein